MTTFVSDLTRSKEEILLDMINHDNDTSFVVGDLMFDTAEPISIGPRNTQIKVYGVNPGRTYGEETLQYNRPDIASVPGADHCAVYVKGIRRISEIVPKINQIMKINLQENDYVDEAIPDMDELERGSRTVIDIVITQDNPIYVGVLPVIAFV